MCTCSSFAKFEPRKLFAFQDCCLSALEEAKFPCNILIVTSAQLFDILTNFKVRKDEKLKERLEKNIRERQP